MENYLRERRFLWNIENQNILKIFSLQRKQNDACVYGSQKCWFKHQSEEQNVIDDKIGGIKTVELVKRLFDMMEAFAERISHVENQM